MLLNDVLVGVLSLWPSLEDDDSAVSGVDNGSLLVVLSEAGPDAELLDGVDGDQGNLNHKASLLLERKITLFCFARAWTSLVYPDSLTSLARITRADLSFSSL